MNTRTRTITAAIGVSTLLLTGIAVSAPAGAAGACISGFSDQGGGICSKDLVTSSTVATITVPAGVTSMTFDVQGAEGGTSNSWWNGSGSPGGKGGREKATVTVTPSDHLQLVVGEAGGTGQIGGWGGGGQPSSNQGGAGGGGSFVFDGTGNPLVVAGGGGGGGFDYNVDNSYATYYQVQRAPGGNGSGAANATDGQSVSFKLDPTYGVTHFAPGAGGGATTSGPGAAGHSAITGNFMFGQVDGISGRGPAAGPLPATPTKAELATYLGAGGDGVHGTCCYSQGHAGAGGGGYYGGGSGGSIEADYDGGGGGGGAGYVAPGATAAQSWTGTVTGDGAITISYKVPSAGTGAGTGSITSFSPSTGGVGTVVTISGTGLGTASAVRFNGVAGTAVKTSAGVISAKVPAGASTGRMSITTSTGTYQTGTNFTFVPAPTISGISPASGSVGMQVTLTGTNLAAVTSVKVGAVVTTPDSVGPTTLTFTIPVGATGTSPIVLTSIGGKTSASTKVVVVPVPAITSLSTTKAAVGTKVIVTGTGLAKATSVTIGGQSTTYKVSGSTTVTLTVPVGATSGAVSITTAGGTATGPTLTIG